MDRRRLAIILFGVSALIIVGIIGLVVVQALSSGNPPKPTPTAIVQPTQAPSPTPTPAKTSPLIFGTNLGLFDNHDQFLTSPNVQTLMKQMHVQIVRMPTRSNNTDDLNTQALQGIKNIGAMPLVALRGSQNPDVAKVLADDTRMINVVNQVFPNETVYYEFGNEDDWNGLPIDRYTAGWNQVIPVLKKLAINGKFVGPVSYQYSHDNLTAFLQGANPRPDAVSWHEYTCSWQDPAALCLASIDKWTTHIRDARAVMQSMLSTTLPIMISEWNYAADQSVQSNGQPYPDHKYDNAAFMSQWTTRALQTLAANGVFASMQYTVTNTALPLITYQNRMTVQGQTLQGLYQKMIPDR